jgi:hypothetical protein
VTARERRITRDRQPEVLVRIDEAAHVLSIKAGKEVSARILGFGRELHLDLERGIRIGGLRVRLAARDQCRARKRREEETRSDGSMHWYSFVRRNHNARRTPRNQKLRGVFRM